MTKDDKDLLLAISIGDGSIYAPRDKRKLKSEFRLNHSTKQFEYLKYKAELIEKIFRCNININFYTATDGTGNKHKVCYITKTEKYFRILRNFLYRSGKKYLSRKVIERLSLHGLAILFMDDGNLYIDKNGAVQIEIGLGCSKEEADIFCDVIYKKYGFEMYPNKMTKSKFYRVRSRGQKASKFIEAIKPIVDENVPSMSYKVNLL